MALLFASAAEGTLAAGDISSMKVNGWASPPIGHVAFCKANPGECTAHGTKGPVSLDGRRLAELREVNLEVNHAIRPATDMAIYRAEEVWTLPGATGDCEDYVLLKRKELIARGWPTSALLVAVVFDEIGDGHAVLVARTSAGDLTLDNKTDEIRLWTATGYRFVKRQSEADPRKWVSVGPPSSAARSTAAPQ